VFNNRFPTFKERKHIWPEHIKSFYPNFKINNNSLVCSKHFDKINFIKTVRSKTFSLVKNAVPLLFLRSSNIYQANRQKNIIKYLRLINLYK